VVFITSSYGLGETVVQGAVNPDEFYVHKPMLKAGKRAVIRRSLGSKLIQMEFASAEEKAATGKLVKTTDVKAEQRNRYSLTDSDVEQLAKYALVIEEHYGRPMDIEWGKDGTDGELYILQARPETVKSQQHGKVEQRFKLKGRSSVLAEGRAIGQKVGTGPVRLVHSINEMDKVQAGDVLVTDMTDPNWEPVMKRASAIVTNRGGAPATRPSSRASSASRRWSAAATPPNAEDGTLVTVSCAEGDTGFIYDGLLETESPRCSAARCRDRDQDHDERRQPAAGLRLRAAAERRRRAWRGSSSSSTTTSACTRRPSSTTRTSMPT
jgi:pyruvate,water dikinase